MRHRRVVHYLASVALLTISVGSRAEASFIVNIIQSGSDVVATGSGSINTTALTDSGSGSLGSEIEADSGTVGLGSSSNTGIEYFEGFNGPSALGSGSYQAASSGAGDEVQMEAGGGFICVPVLYTSGAALSDSATFAGATIADLGLTPGSYVFTWGSGETADSFTVNIQSPTPEPASLWLLGLGGMALVLHRFFHRQRRPAVEFHLAS